VAFGRGGFLSTSPHSFFRIPRSDFSSLLPTGALTISPARAFLALYAAVSGGNRAGIEILHLDAEALVQYARTPQSLAP